ncbi:MULTISPECIES: homoserine dehydrogenase [unclassified Paludibacterium]|uniref:homoserine dehydrogenase n=1 Tax=unclassified Paludibacterium TaxID=2618429 RepID=UPI001C05E7FA|nr:homoserine dehydrogenase [Paludibacterium sp. B53371]BEV72031.1 homoserine dehydrogenase [Paludibacterium sp. THUN1379]
MKPINIGLMGVGTVGGGTATVLKRNAEEISRRAGRRIRLFMAANRDTQRARDHVGPEVIVVDDAFQIVNHPDVDIVVELIGGTTIARELVFKAIDNGKHVVTANKKLIAEYGNEIFARAQEKGVIVAFEAAVAGGVPIIKALRESLAANRVEWIAGIINGTANYILSEMREKGTSFADALADAQRLGYAEADPTFDIEGHDAGHKLTIMASIAFGIPMQFSKCYLEGISQLTAKDISYAEELGYRVKLLGLTRRTDDGIELRVHPTLIPESRLIANVNGVKNAVLVNCDAAGPTLYYGAGAGALPTASAVVADIVDVTRLLAADPEHHVPLMAFQPDQLHDLPILPIDEVVSSYYLRIQAIDRAGVLANITRILAEDAISIEAVIQKGCSHDGAAEVVILTHRVKEKYVNHAIAAIEDLDSVAGPVVRLRMEELTAGQE